MKKKNLLIVGVILLLLGVIGFLASSVALASANRAQTISAGDGVEVTLPNDDPAVVQRRKQAESILFPSLFLGILGGVCLVWGLWTKPSLTVEPLSQQDETE